MKMIIKDGIAKAAATKLANGKDVSKLNRDIYKSY